MSVLLIKLLLYVLPYVIFVIQLYLFSAKIHALHVYVRKAQSLKLVTYVLYVCTHDVNLSMMHV